MLQIVDAVSARDPTGTAGIRVSFRADAQRRLSKARGVTHAFLVGQDFMQHRGEGLDLDPAIKLTAFNRWFRQLLTTELLSGWMTKHIERAYQTGVKFGQQYGVAPGAPLAAPDLLKQSAQHELHGIAEAIIQRVTREIATAAAQRTKPQIMYRRVLEGVKKVGVNRLNALANFTTVKAHNKGRLDQFRALGVTHVGALAERLPRTRHDALFHDAPRDPPTPSEQKAIEAGEALLQELEVVNVETAGDDDVCWLCQEISDDGPYEINTAEALIPAHPDCRCAFVPAFDMRYAINKSKAANGGDDD